MDFGRVDAEAEAAQALVVMTFAHIDRVLFRIRVDDEDRFGVAADAEALALADGIELRPFVRADDGAVGIGLQAGFLDVLLSATIGLVLEADVIVQRGGEAYEVVVRERDDLAGIERAVAQGLAVGGEDLFLRRVADGALQRDAVAQKPVQDALLPLVQRVIGIPGVIDLDDVALDGAELLLQSPALSRHACISACAPFKPNKSG